jgi:hypothetical protein
MKWLFRVTWLYLLIPFVIFCLGWFRLSIALPVAALMLWVLWKLWGDSASTNEPFPRMTIPLIAITGLWVFLSGVGGYAFQNWDHHWRNAILHDLITYDWPVLYSSPERGPVEMLVYYVGYWLPAALAGKLLGWEAANFILFLWTWLGILLTALHLNLKLKTSLFKTTLLLITFSGMDALGTLLLAGDYPALWPPIQHLEIWPDNLQYSSFTTQLFWVFNQAVPAWLCIVLIMNRLKRGEAALTWAVCFFLAPLASIGLLPYLIIEWFEQTCANIKSPLKNVRLDLLFAGLLIVLTSWLFFSSNSAVQERGFQALAMKDMLMFFLLEGGLLWLLLAPRLWREPRWMVTGVLLLLIPFVQVGSGRDFVMRASIAPLFYLMVWCGETIFENAAPRSYRIAFVVMLAIGALTPLYEINRSMYRTFEYVFLLDEDQRATPNLEPVTHLEPGVAPESEHPGTLVADEIRTFAFMNDKLSRNFIANVRQSLYYRFIAPH